MPTSDFSASLFFPGSPSPKVGVSTGGRGPTREAEVQARRFASRTTCENYSRKDLAKAKGFAFSLPATPARVEIALRGRRSREPQQRLMVARPIRNGEGVTDVTVRFSARPRAENLNPLTTLSKRRKEFSLLREPKRALLMLALPFARPREKPGPTPPIRAHRGVEGRRELTPAHPIAPTDRPQQQQARHTHNRRRRRRRQ